MTRSPDTPRASREVVGLFATRESFESAIKALMEAGFDRADLSVLASHESIDVAGEPGKPWRDVLTAMVGEIKYEVPLVASGAILLAGGPAFAPIAGLIGAAVGGVAIKEVLEEVTAKPHRKDFARSLEAGGVILWVRPPGDDWERFALDILGKHGGTNVHVHEPADARRPGVDQ